MPFCNNCGFSVNEGSPFCSNCGAPMSIDDERTQIVNPQTPPQQPVYQQPVYQQPAYQQPVTPPPAYQQPVTPPPVYQQPTTPPPVYQQPMYQQPITPPPVYQQPVTPPPMYQQPMYQQPGVMPGYSNPMQPQLPMKWFNFLIYFALFFGAIVNVITAISSFTESEGVFDIISGILSIGVAAFSVYVRFRLSQYKDDAPKMVVTLYTINLAITVLSIIYLLITTEFEADITLLMPSFAVSAAMLTCNQKYFEKRKHLFVN